MQLKLILYIYLNQIRVYKKSFIPTISIKLEEMNQKLFDNSTHHKIAVHKSVFLTLEFHNHYKSTTISRNEKHVFQVNLKSRG